ncbi:MAG TPA: putative ABC exporter domain-containing protein [Verrucomicrobiae bacterium]|nr:putative ABC exporter domain-containing protein [Verrucomicrobiae bacterium]
MFSALIYLQFQTLKNRIASRFLRLKQPKYLFGAIVGAAYFYFYFGRFFLRAPRGHHDIFAGRISPENIFLLESLGAVILLLVILYAWIVPRERAALTFSESEIAFLFPAPVSRRGLIHFKLLRSQTAILFTVFFMTLISQRFGGSAWIHAASWYLILSTLSLHMLGASFARTMLLERGISNWTRRLVIFGILIAVAAAVFIWARQAIPKPEFSNAGDFAALQDYANKVLASGPVPWLLLPFRILLRPYFAANAMEFLRAFFPALLLLLLHYVWVVRSDVAFEESSLDASRKQAEKIAAMRAGNWRSASRKIKKMRAPFTLASSGPPAMALFWKNLISAGQMVTARFGIFLAIILGCFALSMNAGGRAEWSAVLGTVSAMFIGWSLLVGPQLLRHDFRRDLAHADVLKTFPMRNWEIAVGEILAPAAVLTGAQWLMLFFAPGAFAQFHIEKKIWTEAIFATALVLPPLNFVLFLLPNAGALLFPAWFQSGKDSPRGIEATGQRLIMVFGQLLALIVALVPAATVFAAIFFLMKIYLGVPMIFLPAVGATLVLAGEVVLGVLLLGKIFEKFDLSADAAG